MASGGASFGALRTALFDNIEGGADDGALVLYSAAGAFLGNFLFSVRIELATVSRYMYIEQYSQQPWEMRIQQDDCIVC